MSILDIIGIPKPPDRAVLNFLLRCCTKRTLETSGGLNEGHDSSLKPSPCDSFQQLVAAFNTKRPLTAPATDCLAAALAISISLRIPGPFLWSHLVGPSSSLKTTIAMVVGAAADKCFTVSEFTSLFSGSTVGGKDNSIMPRLQGKMFIVKDLTPLLQAKADVQNTVFGQLRDAYDGKTEKFFNNSVFLQYDGIRFSCLTCTTHAIYKFQRSDMGERFLAIRINSYWEEDGRLIKIDADPSAEGNAYDAFFNTVSSGLEDSSLRLDDLASVRSLAWGFINHLHDTMTDSTKGAQALSEAFKADRTVKNLIDSLAIWLEHARCPKATTAEESSVRPEPAQLHRSVMQLSKAAMCLAVVLGHTGPSPEVVRIVKKWAFDTAFGFALEIMNYVATHPLVSLDMIAARLQLSKPGANNWTAHLISIGVLQTVLKPNNSGNRGRHSLCFELTPAFRIVADTIGLIPQRKNAVEAALAANPLFGSPSLPSPLFGN